MSFELDLPRDAVPPAVARELANLGVTLRDGRTLRLRPRLPPFVFLFPVLRAGRRAGEVC